MKILWNYIPTYVFHEVYSYNNKSQCEEEYNH